MKRKEYLRCPVCGKLSLLGNFQVHRLGGRHKLEIMVQEISSKGRAKIRNKWYSGKISRKRRQELRAVFRDILSHVLDDLTWGGMLDETSKVADKDNKAFEVEDEDEETFEVEDEDEETFEVSDDETFEAEDEDNETFEVSDDETFSVEIEDEETFKVL